MKKHKHNFTLSGPYFSNINSNFQTKNFKEIHRALKSVCANVQMDSVKLIDALHLTCSVWSFGSSLHSNPYKCSTGPASKFLISGGRRSWTCLLQCFSCAACQITSMCSFVILHSIARKLNIIWLCLITWRTENIPELFYKILSQIPSVLSTELL